ERYATRRFGKFRFASCKLATRLVLSCLAWSRRFFSGSGNGSACLTHATCTCSGVTFAFLICSRARVHVPPSLAQLDAPADQQQFTRTRRAGLAGSLSTFSWKRKNTPPVFDMPRPTKTILPSL